MKAIDRFYEYLAEKSLKPTTIEKEIGLSNGYLSVQKKRGADMGEGMMLKIIDYFQDINPLWLLTGEGHMLRDSEISEENVIDCTKKVQALSSDTVALRLMDKIDEKDAKIDQLQIKLRQQSEELAILKAKYPVEIIKPLKGLGSSETAKNANIKKHIPGSDHTLESTNPQTENL